MNSSKLFRAMISAALSASLLLPSALALYPAKVKADSLYLRETPGGAILASLPHDTKVAVISNGSAWFKIAVNGKEGFVSGEYLTGTPNSDFALGSARIACDTTVNLRAQPSTAAGILASMPRNASVTALGVHQGWYKISYNGQTGFVHPDYVTFSAKPATVTTTNAVTPIVSAGTSADRAAVLAFAAQYLGTPYIYGGSTPNGFDCSGFTSYVFANTVRAIPRVAQAQFDGLTRISRDELLPGDLVFFGGSAYSISHVGIYVGDNQFIHSPHTGDVVKYDTLTGTYDTRFQGGARVIAD